MQKIKTKCLRVLARISRSGFVRKGTLAVAAVTVAVGDTMAASKGAAGFTKATQEVSSYQTPVSNLMKAIAAHSKTGEILDTGVKTLPDFMKDATDRNRTSPFAFTGNKFEFRMVGSRDSISECNVVLNTIAAEVFRDACDRLEAADDFDTAVHDLIKEYAIQHQRIVFNGNGYAPEWVS